MNAHRIALTGSIGMGKSTTARLFAAQGVPVWDADAVVHKLYARGGAAVAPIRDLVSAAIVADAVDRAVLRQAIIDDPTLISRIEAVVHPLVAAHRDRFISEATAPILLFDIPLLFETRQQAAYDSIVVVSAPADVQRARVIARPGMTPEAFDAILAKQLPDSEKRAGADYIVDTSQGLDTAREQVTAILQKIRSEADA